MEFRIFSENTLVIQYIIRLGILIMLALQTYALSRSINKSGNRWMFAIFALIIPIYLNDNEVFTALSITTIPGLGIALYLPVIAVPILSYFAILYYIKPKREFTRKDWLLFTPVLINWGMLIPMILYPKMIKEWSGWGIYHFINGYIFEPIFIVLAFCLWYRSLQLLKKHSKDIKLLHSSTEQVDLKWLYGFALSVPLLFISHLLRELFFIDLFYDLGDIIALCVILFLGYNITQQRDVFPYEIDVESIEQESTNKESHNIDDQKINTQREDSQIYEAKGKELKQLMQEKKPYLNPNLNLGDLAFQLNIKPQELSHLLSEQFSINFYSYINQFRVEQCKILLADGKNHHLSMEGIASMAGFKSKSTFYTRFKEFTGVTPLQYIESIPKSN